MSKGNNQIVFTDWYTASINNDSEHYEIPVPKFLKELEKKLESTDYNVFYEENQKRFYITYCGVDYNVLLNKGEQLKLSSGEFSPLILKLFWLAKLEKKYNDEKALQEVRIAKIKAIEESDYEDLDTLEDHELYLEYLENSLKKAKTSKEKNAINTKIAYIVPKIRELKKNEKQQQDNPLNLQLYINRFIYNILAQIEQLDEAERTKMAAKLKKILLDFKKIVDDYNKKKDTGLFIGNPLLPMEILERIIDVEFELKSLLKMKSLGDFVDEELGDVEAELRSVISSAKKEQN